MILHYNIKLIFIILVSGLLLTVCKTPFSTRKPELPSTQQSNWIPARSAEDVIINLQSAISERNIEHFLRCFVDTNFSVRTFAFVPDQEVANHQPDLFINWNLSKEKAVMEQVFSWIPADSVSRLQTDVLIRESTSSDSVVMVRDYSLILPHTQELLPEVFQGQVEFRFHEDLRGEWTIYHWIDNRVSGEDEPWSSLKAALGG